MNIVGHAGPLAEVHGSGMRSFDVRCNSYNPEASGKYKSCEFMLRCYFDIGKRWEGYEPPRAGTLVHIIGQLIGRYKMGRDEKPTVMVTDFKILAPSGNANAVASGGGNSPETITPTKRRYGPKFSGVSRSPAMPDKSGAGISHQIGPSSPVSRGATDPSELLPEDGENAHLTDDEESSLVRITGSSTISESGERLDSTYSRYDDDAEIENQQQRPKRTKKGKGRQREFGASDH